MGTLLLSFQQIKKWAAEFKRGRTSLEDDPPPLGLRGPF